MLTIKCTKCGRTFPCPDETIQMHCPDCGTVMLVMSVFELKLRVRPPLIMSAEQFERTANEIIEYAKVHLGLKNHRVTYIG